MFTFKKKYFRFEIISDETTATVFGNISSMSCVQKDSTFIKMDNSGATSISFETQGKYAYFNSFKMNRINDITLCSWFRIEPFSTANQNFENKRVRTLKKVQIIVIEQ